MNKVVVTVENAFLDRYTGKMCKPGESLTISEERFREIKRSGNFVKLDKKATEGLAAAKNK